MKKIILLLLVINICSAEGLVDRFSEAKQKAEETSELYPFGSPEHQKYLSHFWANYGAVIMECNKKLEAADLSSFEMVFALEESGNVQKVYRNRNTNIGGCLSKKLETGSFPKPKISPLYIHINLSFTS